jgi:hypothetical protein
MSHKSLNLSLNSNLNLEIEKKGKIKENKIERVNMHNWALLGYLAHS